MTDRDDRSPLALGLMWASRVTSLGLEFSLPVLGGYYLDRWRHTSPAATLAGLVLGFAIGMVHLLQIAREGSRPS
ncbi:MAG TPA: AtpZ/AtpI family protein [Isosphaeraceae bacterium]